eukprot:6991176-Prorocentrum_lima.AAC.1
MGAVLRIMAGAGADGDEDDEDDVSEADLKADALVEDSNPLKAIYGSYGVDTKASRGSGSSGTGDATGRVGGA